VAALAISALATPGLAAPPPSQEELLALLREQAQRITILEKRVEELTSIQEEQLTAVDLRPVEKSGEEPRADLAGATHAPAPHAATRPSSRLDFSGDARLRYEENFSDPARDQHRFAVRARVGATYQATERLSLSARIATGSRDDPNSADVTLSNFADDFEVSLDRASFAYDLGELILLGGRFAMPLIVEDTLWDGDVNPQGLGAVYEARLGSPRLRASGLYFVIEEAAAGAESILAAGQVRLEQSLGADFSLQLSGAYYDYRLSSLATADAGDYRTNARAPGGGYLSDFNLVHALGQLSYAGLGDRWPISLTGSYIHNVGARVSGDNAFAGIFTLGTIAEAQQWRFAYRYAHVEQDAVFAAFAQDNIPLASDYRLHEMTADYSLAGGVFLNASLYHYRPSGAAAMIFGSSWRDRFRTSVTVVF
jgi:hypothetical protein